jgi:hypothetical protein
MGRAADHGYSIGVAVIEPPLFGIVANVKSDSVLRSGAKVWINYCNGDAESPVVTGLSRSGYYVTKYTKYKRLTNFRAAWVPMHMRDRVLWAWQEKQQAADAAERLGAKWTDEGESGGVT